jgi:DNA-directed RNA polymerase subunit RPC12/RpoP
VSLYSIRYAQHGDVLIRVAHDQVLRWYMSLDGKKWTPVDRHTLKSALDYSHTCLHPASEKCSEKLEWKLDKSTQAKVLGECPHCANPSMESDLVTFRRCPDCGWRIDFTKEQIQWVEDKLHVRRGRTF